MRLKIISMRRLLLLLLIFSACNKIAIAKDYLDHLHMLVKRAVTVLKLNSEIGTTRMNLQQFMTLAEEKLKMAQATTDTPDFLDEEAMNLGVYLLAIEFRIPQAAQVALARLVTTTTEIAILLMIKEKLEFFQKIDKQAELSPEWRKMTVESELQHIRERLLKWPHR
jgi:hypothetical protein